MKDKLLIIGASGHGRVVADIGREMKKWQIIDFLDDDLNVESPVPINLIGRVFDDEKYIDDYDIFVAIGNNLTRRRIYQELESKGASLPCLIHPSAILGDNVSIGGGTVIMAGTVINNSTIIGRGVIINTSSSIDHDNRIGDFVHISPGGRLAGTVAVGDSSWLGIGSVVSNNVNICADVILGAGAVVISDITAPGTYVGVPAKIYSSKQ